MKKESFIRILFVENSIEETEQIIRLLRHMGIAVRPFRAMDLEQVRTGLSELDPDVMLFDPALGIHPSKLIDEIEAYGSDLALIALATRIDWDQGADLIVNGVRGIALRHHPKQLAAILQREFEALKTRQQVRWLETALRESERRCDALLDSSTDAIAYVHDGMHVRANRVYLETFGFEDFDDLLGLPVLDMIEDTDADIVKSMLRAHSRNEEANANLDLQARRADGSTFKASVEFAHAMFEGEPCLQIIFRRQQADPAVIAQLQHDQVTGLFNRPHMLECIDESVASAAKGKDGQSLLLIEPDNWQNLVSDIGLSQTDELLATFANRVSALLGAGDIAGLLADHTIGVVLNSRSDKDIRRWIDDVQQAVSREIFDLGAHSITVTASVGGSLLGEKNANTELLLNQASQALRNAKGQGMGRMELYDPAAREKADEEHDLYWVELIKQALTQNNFTLYHQHIISLQDAEGEYSEILLRMNSPKGEVLPNFFMPIAEKYGLTATIDRWVIEHALKALKARDSQGTESTFFVKLSTTTLQSADMLDWLAGRLKRYGLRYGHIVLEMTENKVVTMLRPAQAFVQGWKKLGGRFALEQFGSSLNSFQLLQHIEADYLKIDRTFITQLPRHPENQQKIGEIRQQARDLGKFTVAEWVEDAASTSLLFACGVDFVQGNFLEEPQPLLQ